MSRTPERPVSRADEGRHSGVSLASGLGSGVLPIPSSPAGGQPLLPAASRPCRAVKDGCKRIARPDSPWCLTHFVQLVSGAYSPKNESVAMDAYVKRQS